MRQILAFVPLILVALMNKYLTTAIPAWYPNGFDFAALGLAEYTVDVTKTCCYLGCWNCLNRWYCYIDSI